MILVGIAVRRARQLVNHGQLTHVQLSTSFPRPLHASHRALLDLECHGGTTAWGSIELIRNLQFTTTHLGVKSSQVKSSQVKSSQNSFDFKEWRSRIRLLWGRAPRSLATGPAPRVERARGLSRSFERFRLRSLPKSRTGGRPKSCATVTDERKLCGIVLTVCCVLAVNNASLVLFVAPCKLNTWILFIGFRCEACRSQQYPHQHEEY